MQVCPAVWLAQSPSHHSLSRPGSLKGATQPERAPQQWRAHPTAQRSPQGDAETHTACKGDRSLQYQAFPPYLDLHGSPRVAQMDVAPPGSALWAHNRNNHSAFGMVSCSRTGQPPEMPASHPGLPIFTHWDLRKLGEIVSSSKQFDQEMHVDVCNWVQKYTFSEF